MLTVNLFLWHFLLKKILDSWNSNLMLNLKSFLFQCFYSFQAHPFLLSANYNAVLNERDFRYAPCDIFVTISVLQRSMAQLPFPSERGRFNRWQSIPAAVAQMRQNSFCSIELWLWKCILECTATVFVSSLQAEESQPLLPLQGIEITLCTKGLSSQIGSFVTLENSGSHSLLLRWCISECCPLFDSTRKCYIICWLLGIFKMKNTPLILEVVKYSVYSSFIFSQLCLCSQASASGFRPKWMSSRWV